jgi:hypothetical protein
MVHSEDQGIPKIKKKENSNENPVWGRKVRLNQPP